MFVWCPVMDWSPIQSVFPLNTNCSRDSLWIHRGPDRIKCLKMKMNEEIKCMNAGPAPRLLHNLGKALEFHANITSSQIVSSEKPHCSCFCISGEAASYCCLFTKPLIPLQTSRCCQCFLLCAEGI